MKSYQYSVEEVSEYAKYLVLTGRTWQLHEEQLYLFSKQHHKQLIIQRNGYDYAVTDSPLQLCSFYSQTGYYPPFNALVDDITDSFENINFFLTRKIENFEEKGRIHCEEESLQVELDMREYLIRQNITFTDINVDLLAPWKIMDLVSPGKIPFPVFNV